MTDPNVCKCCGRDIDSGTAWRNLCLWCEEEFWDWYGACLGEQQLDCQPHASPDDRGQNESRKIYMYLGFAHSMPFIGM